jgi:2-polyprenyl-3-methyl-5-hydroxy-6-metoxy-1,4-benzoquinol methylase
LNSGSNASCDGNTIVYKALHIGQVVTMTPAGHYFGVTIREVIPHQKILKAVAASCLKCFRIQRKAGILFLSSHRRLMESWVILCRAFF